MSPTFPGYVWNQRNKIIVHDALFGALGTDEKQKKYRKEERLMQNKCSINAEKV